MIGSNNKTRGMGSAITKQLKKYTMVLIMIGLCIIFSIIAPSFFSPLNIRNLIIQNSHILIVAVGLSFVMMSGSLDLSVGYQMSAVGVLTAMLMTTKGFSPAAAMICGILLGMTCGFLNGFLAVLLKIEALVVTIATTAVFQGVSYLISKGIAYNNFPNSFRLISKGSLFGIRMDVCLAILAVALASIVYNFTYFGRYVKAMGGNVEATRLAGINTNLMRIATFVISGFFVAIAAFILISKQGTTNSSVGPGTEMTGMTAAILGGISFNSGEGKMWGLVVGVFVLAIIENGMQLAGWNQYIQYVIKGLVLIAAIGFDQYQRSAKRKKSVKKIEAAA